jgi:hypothetical protein
MVMGANIDCASRKHPESGSSTAQQLRWRIKINVRAKQRRKKSLPVALWQCAASAMFSPPNSAWRDPHQWSIIPRHPVRVCSRALQGSYTAYKVIPNHQRPRNRVWPAADAPNDVPSCKVQPLPDLIIFVVIVPQRWQLRTRIGSSLLGKRKPDNSLAANLSLSKDL